LIPCRPSYCPSRKRHISIHYKYFMLSIVKSE